MRKVKIRTAIGSFLLFFAIVGTYAAAGEGRLQPLILVFACAWIFSLMLTQKYIHKYPQRYLTYLFASHLKAGISMAFFLWVLSLIIGQSLAPPGVFWKSFIFFSIADALVSLVWRWDPQADDDGIPAGKLQTVSFPRKSADGLSINPLDSSSEQAAVGSWEACRELAKPFVEFIEKNIPDPHGKTCRVFYQEEIPDEDEPSSALSFNLIASRARFNDIRRLNKFFLFCANRLQPGGYFVGRYTPLENTEKKKRRRYRRLFYAPVAALHFLWYRAFPKLPYLNTLYFLLTKGKNRVFSKTEIWGRLESCGMRVFKETTGDGEVFLAAHKVADPVQGKNPSYFPIIALERVGLNGRIIRAHKVRTMYPFSEFLQKRVFEDSALGTTGKFAGDFRITGYGRFLRKYWLDEIPQIWDWWHGEIKFVGLRAVSRHYFSLYSKEFQDLYIKVKPGLIPPIFSETTAGFDQIIDVERKYLQSYLEHPARTDLRYFFKTIRDIFFKGVRSH